MSKCLADLLDSIGSFLTLLRFLSFVGSQCFDREKLVEVLNLGFGFQLMSAVRARLPGQLVRGTSRRKCRSVVGTVEVSELFTRLSCRASKLATAWALESQVWERHQKTFQTKKPTFDSSSLRSFCLSALKFSVYSFCSIAFSDMQLPHSSQGSFWPHCDDVVRTSREGRVCDFVDSAQRPQRALVEGQNLHCTQKTTWFVAWAQPSSVIFARTSITCIHHHISWYFISSSRSCCHMTSQDDGSASPRPGHPTWSWRTSSQHLPVRVAKWEGFGRVCTCLRPRIWKLRIW